jgi:hypothetical protein
MAPNALVPHSMKPATPTISLTASAVTAGIVRSSTAGRAGGPSRRARRPATAVCVCSSWRSIRARCAAISRFLLSTSGAASTLRIESSGMPRSRSLLITWAEGTWPAS